jgi:uncharacterized membrane protein
VLIPSDDPVAAWSLERAGGALGRHAARFAGWWTPARVLVGLTAVAFLLGVAQKAPCISAGFDRNSTVLYSRQCYSDIPLLYRERGLVLGNVPYLQHGNYPDLEYPVLTGMLMELGSLITHLLPGTSTLTPDAASVRFFGVTVVLLFLLAVVTVLATAGAAGPRGRTVGAMVAMSPVLVLSGTINWDLLPVALTSLAILAWARSRPELAGALLGLGGAAKLYPLFLLGPLLILCLRAGRLRSWLSAAGFAVAAWLVVNLPFVLAGSRVRQAWEYFWVFSRTRPVSFGSIFFLPTLDGGAVAHPDRWSNGLFALGCLGVAALIWFARDRPRVAQVMFLTVVAFTLTGKVYSPQYVLWLLPLAALARPRWRDLLIWQAAEVFYWLTIWWYLGGYENPGDGTVVVLYGLGIGVRIAGELYLAAVIVRDVLSPRHDPVRAAAAAAQLELRDPESSAPGFQTEFEAGFDPDPGADVVGAPGAA